MWISIVHLKDVEYPVSKCQTGIQTSSKESQFVSLLCFSVDTQANLFISFILILSFSQKDTLLNIHPVSSTVGVKLALNVTAKRGCICLIKTLSTLAGSQRCSLPPKEGERNFGFIWCVYMLHLIIFKQECFRPLTGQTVPMRSVQIQTQVSRFHGLAKNKFCCWFRKPKLCCFLVC